MLRPKTTAPAIPQVRCAFWKSATEFQRRLRRAYQSIAREETGRCHIVNADRSPYELALIIRDLLGRLLKNL